MKQKVFIGWKEWCGLPALDVPLIKAKVDTGAKTSALHAFDVSSYHRQGALFVKFKVHPLQANERVFVACHAKVVDKRYVVSSNGQKEKRYVIESELQLGPLCYPIQVTLTNRDVMQFRFLLGRDALSQHTLIDPAHEYSLGRPNRSEIKKHYKL